MNDIELLEQRAIDAAINLRWENAIDLNKQVLKLNDHDECTYLRLGFIYLQMKDIVKAKKYYSKALKIQPRNTVAIQNLERIRVLEKEKHFKENHDQVAFDPELFMDLPGKTKMIVLSNLGQKKVLAGLNIGQFVNLKVKKRRVEVRTTSDEYIGTLPDDVSKRLIFFFKAKSTYLTYIKESTFTRVAVFIKEAKKGRAVASQISFPQHMSKKIDESVINNVNEEKEEDPADEQEEHVEDTWEKIVQDGANNEDKEILIDIQRDDLEEEE